MENTRSPLLHSSTIVWLILILLTTATYLLALLGIAGNGLIISVLLFALIKGSLVIDWYMGLRWVSGFWRPMLRLYLATIGTCIIVAFIFPFTNQG
jgi:hypothetical protein